MSYARNIRRRQQREGQPHLMMLGSLLGDFYEFLSKQPQPTDNEVRSNFISSNNKWKKYCKVHKLMNSGSLVCAQCSRGVEETYSAVTTEPIIISDEVAARRKAL